MVLKGAPAPKASLLQFRIGGQKWYNHKRRSEHGNYILPHSDICHTINARQIHADSSIHFSHNSLRVSLVPKPIGLSFRSSTARPCADKQASTRLVLLLAPGLGFSAKIAPMNKELVELIPTISAVFRFVAALLRSTPKVHLVVYSSRHPKKVPCQSVWRAANTANHLAMPKRTYTEAFQFVPSHH
jgi:hypothetical protein